MAEPIATTVNRYNDALGNLKKPNKYNDASLALGSPNSRTPT